MKRRAHTTGRGRGAHSPQTLYGRKIKGPVKPVVSHKKHGKQMTYSREVTDGCARPAAIITALIIALLLMPRCGRGQIVFHFNTSTVVMEDTTGQMDTGSASWPVIASGDSLIIGIPARPLLWHGIKWVKMDNGDLHCMTPHFRAHYKPGPGGKSLLVMPAGAIRVIELYEK